MRGSVGPSDLVAVRLTPGPEWTRIVADVWEAGAALFPVDHRLPETEAAALLTLARPTVVLDADEWERLEEGVPAGDGVAVVVATSGTAGRPKLVQFRRSAIDAAVAASALALEAGPHDPWLCCLPLAHVGGLLVLMRAVLLGAPVVVHPRFEPEAVAAQTDTVFTALVPTMLGRLLDGRVDLTRFRAILVGGSGAGADRSARAADAGAPIVETYGLTESCGGVVYEGRPLVGVEVRLGPEQEIQLRGSTAMLGYRFDPDGTRAAFTPDGWLRTADAGTLSADGRLTVAGRLDEAILSGGEKIWPEEVEAALRDHPGVADVAVAGRADLEWGSRVVAFVLPADASRPPALEELRDHAAARIPRFKAPRELAIVEDLPRTTSGKIRRSALR